MIVMNKKEKIGWGVGLGLVGVGVAIGAYAAKKYWDKRKKLLQNYSVEVDRLQNEVDFDYSEDFLKELKKETLRGEKKSYTKEDVKVAVKENTDALKKAIRENTDALKVNIAKLEKTLKDYRKAEKQENDTVAVDIDVTDVVADDSDFEDEDVVGNSD